MSSSLNFLAKSMKPFIGRFALFSSFAPDDPDVDPDSFLSLAGDAGGGDDADDATTATVFGGATAVTAETGVTGVAATAAADLTAERRGECCKRLKC